MNSVISLPCGGKNNLWAVVVVSQSKMSARLERIVSLILKEHPELTREYVLELINSRMKELGGLIKREGAALLVARELGVNIPHEEVIINTSRLRLKDLVPGLRNLQLIVRVLEVGKPYTTRTNKILTSFIVSDGTRVITLKLWGPKGEELASRVKPGDCLIIKGAYTRKYQGELEIGLADDAIIKVSSDEICEDVPSLEELASKYGKPLILTSLSAAKSDKGVYLLGITQTGKIACGLITSLNGEITEGSRVVVQNSRITYEDDALVQFLANVFSRVTVMKGEKVEFPEPLWIDGVEGFSSIKLLEGYFLTYTLRRGSGYTVYLGGHSNLLRLLSFEDDTLTRFFGLKFGEKITIGPLKPLRAGYKLLPCFILRKSGEKLSIQTFEQLSLEESANITDIEATISSIYFNFRIIGGKPISTVYIDLSSSGAILKAVSNNSEIFELLTGITLEEAKALYEEKILSSILDYLREELAGASIRMSCLSYPNGTAIILEVEEVSKPREELRNNRDTSLQGSNAYTP